MHFIVLALLAICEPQPSLGLQQHEMRELATDYSIQVKYPEIPHAPEFNRAVLGAINSLVADLKHNSTGDDEKNRFRNSLRGSYKAEVLKNGIVSVLLDYSEDASTAVHPWGVMAVVNYDSRTCRVLKLSDLFQPGTDYVARISQLAIEALKRNEFAEPTAIEHGAGPVENNFRFFTLTDTSLVLNFPMYQVAAGAAGDQIVEIPFAQLAPLLNSKVIDLRSSR